MRFAAKGIPRALRLCHYAAMKFPNRIVSLVAFAALSFPAASACAQSTSFDAYMAQVAAKARSQGVSEGTIQRMMGDLTPNQRVIELDRAQPGTPSRSGFAPMAPYIAQHVDNARISGGKRTLAAMGGRGSAIEQKYGVPMEIVTAIFGHETNYGSYTGDFDLSRSLATLAWEGRRRAMFESEFIDLLKIADKGYPREQLKGSWAGAFGYPQFMPSIYLRLAVDGDGDGRANLWSNRTDALASIANYFRDAGWRTGEPWGVRVTIPAGFNRSSFTTKLVSPVCPRVHERQSQWKTVREWRAEGIQTRAPIGDNVLTALFEPDGPGTPAYLLTGNYRVITEYNCSSYYALSVGLLADEIAR